MTLHHVVDNLALPLEPELSMEREPHLRAAPPVNNLVELETELEAVGVLEPTSPNKVRDAAFKDILATYQHNPEVERALTRYGQYEKAVGSTSNPDRMYMQEIGRYPLLTKQDEEVIFGDIEQGLAVYWDSEGNYSPAERHDALVKFTIAYNKAYHSNLRLVVHMASKYSAGFSPSMSFMDIVQEANIAGLATAVRRFEIGRNLKFSTFATWWIRAAIQKGISRDGRTIRIPTDVHERWERVQSVTRTLVKELNREPTIDEIAERTMFDSEEVAHLKRVGAAVLTSLNRKANEEGDMEVGDMIADNDQRPSEYDVLIERQEIWDTVSRADLTAREKIILSLCSGIYFKDLSGEIIPRKPSKVTDNPKLVYDDVFRRHAGGGMTLEDIGAYFGMTRERIRQLQKGIHQKLNEVRSYDD